MIDYIITVGIAIVGMLVGFMSYQLKRMEASIIYGQETQNQIIAHIHAVDKRVVKLETSLEDYRERHSRKDGVKHD